jgi:glycosyltransferase involved in cell wall biosynthesis
VAFFPDSLTEINGVARTSRELLAFATQHGHPFLCVHAGSATRVAVDTPAVTRLELSRGRLSFGLERDLRFDLGLWRYTTRVAEALRAFGPDVIHVTGPSDIGQLGAYLAHTLGVPLVASWHTNLHDFAERRLHRLLAWTPHGVRRRIAAAAGRQSLALVVDFYKLARVLLAPNDELAALLRSRTRRPVFPMPRGVDTVLFNPDRRRPADAGSRPFTIGYVGRLSPEKNVRDLAALEAALTAGGAPPFRFLIVGDGSERPWLERHMRCAAFPGVLTGEALADAYAALDVFVFPSTTDTYGNVVQEAFASGTPVVVTSTGGPRFLVQDGLTGFVRGDVAGYAEAVVSLARDPHRAAAMGAAARARALDASWSRVCEQVYDAYRASRDEVRPARADAGHERRELSWLARAVTASLSRKRRRPMAPVAPA